jgi:hypothetical protein
MILKRKAQTVPAVSVTDFAIKVDDKISTVPITSLKLWANNPRKNDGAVPKLVKILEVRGQVTPVVADRKTKVIYKGNTTVKALKAMGETTVKVLFADFKSEQSAIAYGIADNKSGEFAEWDDAVLSTLITAELVSAKESIGYSEKELSVVKAGGGFAAQSFSDLAATMGEKEKKDAYWFWFEVPTEEDFQRINQQYGRIAGEKRLHRELDPTKMLEVL